MMSIMQDNEVGCWGRSNMGKTAASIVAVAILAASLAACSSGASSSASSSATSASGSAAPSTSLFVSDEWPRNETTGEVPAPKFSSPIESLSVSDRNVKADWANVPESEVSSFVDELKAAGFVIDPNEKKSPEQYFYSATNNEDATKCVMVAVTYSGDGALSVQVADWRI